jgi:hypothetical protein
MPTVAGLPTNFNPNHAPTAAEMQSIIDLLTQCAQPPRAALRRNSNQSIANSTWTAITWNAQDKLRNMTWSSGTNPTRVTATVAGAYRATAFVQYENNATGTRTIAFLVNGGATQVGMIRVGATSQPVGIGSTVVLDLAVGDYFEVRVWQD